MRILAPTDGSESAQHALMIAAEHAEKMGAELHVLTVVPRMTPMASPVEGYQHKYLIPDMEEVEESYKKVLAYSEKQVHEFNPDIKVVTYLETGRPSQIIVDKAEELDVEMVVMGSRGIGGITGWVLGSTSKKVVEQCKCQVLVVK